MSNHPLDHAARAMLAQFPSLAAHGVRTVLPQRGGFSEAHVWRIGAESGSSFFLRAWPLSTDSQRVAWVHHLMARARVAGLDFVPCVFPAGSGQTGVMHAGRIWEVQQWMSGAADFHRHPTPIRLQAACTALGRVHAVWCNENQTVSTCPGVLRRVALVSQWRDLVASGWRPLDAAPRQDPLHLVAVRALRVLPWHIEQASRQLRAVSTALPLQPCLRDPWHDHYLFDGDCLTGLIDYGAVEIDHPAVDLARTLGSLVEDDDEAWHAGVAAYRTVRALSQCEENLARLLDRSGVILSLARWLMRLFHAREVVADRPALARRLEQMLSRIEKWPTA
jgi:aminoglycoside phosphotransferase (APT) family kinase protein